MKVPKFKLLDVRPILARGDDPFSKIRKTVDALRPGQRLSVIAPFLPSPLIEKLSSEGFRSNAQHQPDGAWIVNFWRED